MPAMTAIEMPLARQAVTNAFEESKDPQRLLQRTLHTLAETPGFRVCREKPSLRPR